MCIRDRYKSVLGISKTDDGYHGSSERLFTGMELSGGALFCTQVRDGRLLYGEKELRQEGQERRVGTGKINRPETETARRNFGQRTSVRSFSSIRALKGRVGPGIGEKS